MRTITVAGGTLFHLAADLYGDATLWTLLAEANGLKDPLVTGVVALVVPVRSVGNKADG